MKKSPIANSILVALLAGSFGMTVAHAADPIPGIVGKSDWLFYRYEISDTVDIPTIDTSVGLISRFNKVLAANGVTMAVTMVPLKMRIYSEFVPDDIKINDTMRGNYERISKQMQAAQLQVLDLNKAFLNSPKRTSETPLFFRLDTHWAPAGALLAGETIKTEIDANPVLKKVYDEVPPENFKLVVGKRKINAKARDLVEQLPKPPAVYAPEQTFAVDVSRATPAKEDLLGNAVVPAITLVGSSYSNTWTGFPDAVRYSLQRDILSISVGADQGSWVGMESYLRDDAFQTKPPKLMIWEMPERDMRAPPDYRFRDPRYLTDNTEWLLRVSAWVQSSCKPSTVTAKLGATGLGANAAFVKGEDVRTGGVGDADFIEINFDKPLDKLDYISARAITAGSKTVTLEASGAGVPARRFTVQVAGDDAAHALKVPLPSRAAGYTKVKVFPGKSNSFAWQTLKVCRQPEDLLK